MMTHKPMTDEYRKTCIEAVREARKKTIHELLERHRIEIQAELEHINLRYDEALLGIPQVSE
mgnify:CR=1 FL=1